MFVAFPQLDEDDRKLKRQERFGAVTSVSTKPLTDSLAVSLALFISDNVMRLAHEIR